jgi:hypothetical protein
MLAHSVRFCRAELLLDEWRGRAYNEKEPPPHGEGGRKEEGSQWRRFERKLWLRFPFPSRG